MVDFFFLTWRINGYVSICMFGDGYVSNCMFGEVFTHNPKRLYVENLFYQKKLYPQGLKDVLERLRHGRGKGDDATKF